VSGGCTATAQASGLMLHTNSQSSSSGSSQRSVRPVVAIGRTRIAPTRAYAPNHGQSMAPPGVIKGPAQASTPRSGGGLVASPFEAVQATPRRAAAAQPRKLPEALAAQPVKQSLSGYGVVPLGGYPAAPVTPVNVHRLISNGAQTPQVLEGVAEQRAVPTPCRAHLVGQEAEAQVCEGQWLQGSPCAPLTPRRCFTVVAPAVGGAHTPRRQTHSVVAPSRSPAAPSATPRGISRRVGPPSSATGDAIDVERDANGIPWLARTPPQGTRSVAPPGRCPTARGASPSHGVPPMACGARPGWHSPWAAPAYSPRGWEEWQAAAAPLDWDLQIRSPAGVGEARGVAGPSGSPPAATALGEKGCTSLSSSLSAASFVAENERLLDEEWWWKHFEDRRRGGAPPDTGLTPRPCPSRQVTGDDLQAPMRSPLLEERQFALRSARLEELVEQLEKLQAMRQEP